jgi:multidrug efflux pump subunit AcrB
VARVELGAQSYAAFTRVNAQPSTTIGVFQLPEANALDVARAVKAELKRLSERFPSGVEQIVRYDPTQFVPESIREVMHTLFAAIALGVPGRLRLPRGTWRATLIPRRHDPRLADRHARHALRDRIRDQLHHAVRDRPGDRAGRRRRDRGGRERGAPDVARDTPRREAVLRSMGEVTSAIVAATLVLGAVFTPVALLPGHDRRHAAPLRRRGDLRGADLAAQRAHALARAVRARDAPEREHKAAFFRAFDRGFAAVVARYDRGVRALLPRRGSCSAVLAVLFLANIAAVPLGADRVHPDEDQGYFITSFQLPDGASIERTDAVAREIEKILSRRRASSGSTCSAASTR